MRQSIARNVVSVERRPSHFWASRDFGRGGVLWRVRRRTAAPGRRAFAEQCLCVLTAARVEAPRGLVVGGGCNRPDVTRFDDLVGGQLSEHDFGFAAGATPSVRRFTVGVRPRVCFNEQTAEALAVVETSICC